MIDLPGVAYSATNETADWTPGTSGGTLAISAGGALVNSINFAGSYSPGYFGLIGNASDGTSGGTEVVATDTWTNGTSDAWTTAGNWSDGSPPVANQEAVILSGGTPDIESDLTLDAVVVKNSGTIAVTASAVLALQDSAVIGGTITNSGSITTTTAGGAIDNATIDNSRSITVDGTLTLDDTTINGGIITGAGTGNGGLNIDHGDTLTLNGVTALGNGGGTGELSNSGTVTLENGLTISGSSFTLELTNSGTVSLGGGTISGLTAGETFENNGNTISGSGTIGNSNDDLTLDNNAGTIDATGGTLTIDTGNTITNAGTLQVDSAANSKLKIEDSTIDNSSNIQLDGTNSGTQVGGTLVVAVPSSGTLTLDGNGTVSLSTGLIAAATGTSGETLVNDGNAILSTGTSGIGNGTELNFDNAAGSIEVTGGTLIFATAETVTNAASITVDDGAHLQFNVAAFDITSTGTLTIDGTLALDIPSNGTLTLSGGGHVNLGGGTITGAAATNVETLHNEDNISGYGEIGNAGTDPMVVHNDVGGTIDASVSGKMLAIFNGDAIDNAGTLEAANGATLVIGPNGIGNSGNIQIDGTLSVSDAANPGSTFTLDDLSGTAGTLTLAGGSIVTTISGGETFENNGNTISGYGTIGDVTNNYLSLDNASGAIDANVSSQTLTIETNNTVTNAGTLEASAGGQLSVHDAVDNSGGAVVASGGFVDFWHGIAGGNATIANGGTLEYGWSSDVATAFAGAGTLVLDNQNQSGSNFSITPYTIGTTTFDTASYNGTVSGFGAGDTIDVTDLAYSANETLTWTQGSGTLAITSGGQTADVTLAGSYSQSNFTLESNSSGATDIVYSAPAVVYAYTTLNDPRPPIAPRTSASTMPARSSANTTLVLGTVFSTAVAALPR